MATSAAEINVLLKLKDEMSKSLKNSEKNVKTLAKGIVAGFAAIGTTTVVAISQMADFGAELNNVGTLLDGDVTPQLDMFSEQLRILATRSGGTNLRDLSEGLFYVVSAGVDAADSIKYLDDANKLAIAGQTQLSTSIQALVGFTKAYGDVSVDSATAANLLFNINKKGFTTFDEVASSINKVAPAANTLGVAQDELAASFASLVGTIGTASETSTSLKAVFVNLEKPSTDMAAALDNMGFSSGFAAVEALGLQGTLDALKEQMGGTDEGFSQLFNSAEAFAAASQLAGAQSENFTKNLELMKDTSDVVTKAFELQTEGIKAQYNMIKNNLSVTLITLADDLFPNLGESVKAINDKWAEFNVNLIKNKDLMDDIAKFIQKNIIYFEILATVIGTILVLAAKALVIASLPLIITLGEIILISAAVVLAIEGIIYVFEHWGEISENLKGMIKSAFTGIGQIITVTMHVIGTVISEAGNGMVEVFNFALDLISQKISDAWNWIVSITENVFNSINDFFSSTWETIKGYFDSGLDAVSQSWSNTWEGMKGIMIGVWDSIKTIIMDSINWVIDKINAVINLANSLTSKVGGKQLSTLSPVGFAEGGIVPKYFASGGMTPRGSDTVPAMLTPGELILNAAQQKNLANGIGGNTYVININGNVSSREVAEEYADLFFNKFKLHAKVS